MNATVADLNPKTLDSAKRQFVELYGSALVLNTYLKIALVLVSLVALGLLGAILEHRACKAVPSCQPARQGPEFARRLQQHGVGRAPGAHRPVGAPSGPPRP